MTPKGGYRLLKEGSRIPAEGGKLIQEFVGRVAGGEERFSVAQLVAPPGWSEPAQRPRFHEITLMLSGRKRVEVDGEAIELGPGEVLVVYAGSRVRYANPFHEPAVYWSVCLPAFSAELANREEE